jgi:hypothetical protein
MKIIALVLVIAGALFALNACEWAASDRPTLLAGAVLPGE